MNKDYLITIIIVTFNAEKYILNVLESLTSRINQKTEVVIVDGLSNDNTVKIIKNFAGYSINLISEKDSGIYDAMNKGVSIAKGEFILFLGADDQLFINLKELSGNLVDSKTIYYGDVILSPSNKIYGGKFNTAKLLNRNICHQSILYPREVFDEYKYGNDYKLMEDYVMNLKLWSSKKFNFNYLDKIISIYNITGLSSISTDTKFKKDSFKIIFKYFGAFGIAIKLINPIRNIFNFQKIV
jgi:glycosyltransferase involved in cell wall biosynthesis